LQVRSEWRVTSVEPVDKQTPQGNQETPRAIRGLQIEGQMNIHEIHNEALVIQAGSADKRVQKLANAVCALLEIVEMQQRKLDDLRREMSRSQEIPPVVK
jgi:hypothetical protein